jgi:hypothetical protein
MSTTSQSSGERYHPIERRQFGNGGKSWEHFGLSLDPAWRVSLHLPGRPRAESLQSNGAHSARCSRKLRASFVPGHRADSKLTCPCEKIRSGFSRCGVGLRPITKLEKQSSTFGSLSLNGLPRPHTQAGHSRPVRSLIHLHSLAKTVCTEIIASATRAE